MSRSATAAAALLLLAICQLTLFVQTDDVSGSWFLYGRDTIFHDAIVHLRIQQWLRAEPSVIPLWMPGVQGGLPALGAWLWTPFSPAVWPLYLLDYPWAQWLGWLLCLWTGGLGAYAAARRCALRAPEAFFAAAVWMLCGHVVTLIHAGHFQKVAALGWLPWALAGALMLARPGRRLGGAALSGGAIGAMFLAGHPQIAYSGLVLTGVTVIAGLQQGRARRAWKGALAGLAAVPVIAGLTGAAQLLPGLEMTPLSNRAGGVSYEEAVATSYPPGELPEFLWPRYKGSSLPGDVYTGAWGERIVSDYIGLLPVLLIPFAFLGPVRRQYAFLFLAVLALSLLVGVGRYTPVYRLLYDYAPGFSSFRSPGTFMAPASLAIAMLAGMGCGHAARLVLRRKWLPWKTVTVIICAAALAHSLNVMVANRHFLIGFEWQRFQFEFLNPTEVDLWAMEENRAQEIHNVASPLSLRPILFDGRALNGYHPISYQLKEEQDRALGFQSAPWAEFYGVRYYLTYGQPAGAGDRIAAFPQAQRSVYRVSRHGQVRRLDGGEIAYSWLRMGPNRAELAVNTGASSTVRVSHISGAGAQVLVNGSLYEVVSEPSLQTEAEIAAGESVISWRYQPFSWRLGLYITAMGIALLMFLSFVRIRDERWESEGRGVTPFP